MRRPRLIEPATIQVSKKDAAGQEIKDDKGNPVMEEQKVETQTIPQGPDGLPGGDQDAWNEWRRFFQCQCLPSLREPDPSVQLHSDAFHLSYPKRSHLLSRQDGQESEARLGGLGSHGHSLPCCCPGLLVGRGCR